MSRANATVALLQQAAGSRPYFFERINTILKMPGLRRFRAAVAYARWDGLGLIAADLESFLKYGGDFQAIYGIANGVTTPDSLLYSLYLQEVYSNHTYAGGVEDQYSNATFHPKFFEFQFESKTVAIIGSANLTGAGLSRNTEIGVELELPPRSPLANELDTVWNAMHAASAKITLATIRSSKGKGGLGSEFQQNEIQTDKIEKLPLLVAAKAHPKPLFAKVLDLSQPKKKANILAKLDPLTVRPKKLYLQILSETGSQVAGSTGYQIQLPVATLGAFFGVGAQQTKQAKFHFPTETITVNLTHFPNNTHRVRLRPLRGVARPAIVVFQRKDEYEYECTIVPPKDYNKILTAKCTEHTRAGSRKWGFN